MPNAGHETELTSCSTPLQLSQRKKSLDIDMLRIIFNPYLEAMEICEAALRPPNRPARWSIWSNSSMPWLTKAPLMRSPADMWWSSGSMSGSGSSNLDLDRERAREAGPPRDLGRWCMCSMSKRLASLTARRCFCLRTACSGANSCL